MRMRCDISCMEELFPCSTGIPPQRAEGLTEWLRVLLVVCGELDISTTVFSSSRNAISHDVRHDYCMMQKKLGWYTS